MTYPAFDADEVTPAVLTHPELVTRWKTAAQHNLIKSVGRGRYSAVLDDHLANALRHALPGLAVYNYDDGNESVSPALKG